MAGRIVMQVHDELLVEVPTSTCDAAKEAIRVAMETCEELTVPLTVKIVTGPDWHDLH